MRRAAARSLESPATCQAQIVLHANQSLPADPATRAKATAIEEQLAKLKVLEYAARFNDGLKLADEAYAAATAAHLTQLAATAEYKHGTFEQFVGHLDASETRLEHAAFLAQTSGNDETVVRAYSFLAFVLGSQQNRFDAAHLAIEVARGGLARLGPRVDLEGTILSSEAMVLDREEKPAAAIPIMRRVVEIKRQTDDDFGVAIALRQLARTQVRAGHAPEGMATLREAIALFEKVQGTDGQLVGYSEGLLADLLVNMHRPDEAIAPARHSTAVAIKVYGEQNHYVIEALESLGFVLLCSGHYDEAVTTLERAIAIADQIHDPARHVAVVWQLLGRTRREMHELEPARQALETCLSIPQASKLSNVERAQAELSLAETLWDLERERERARQLAEDAESLYSKSSPGEIGGGLREVQAWRKAHDPQR